MDHRIVCFLAIMLKGDIGISLFVHWRIGLFTSEVLQVFCSVFVIYAEIDNITYPLKTATNITRHILFLHSDRMKVLSGTRVVDHQLDVCVIYVFLNS